MYPKGFIINDKLECVEPTDAELKEIHDSWINKLTENSQSPIPFTTYIVNLLNLKVSLDLFIDNYKTKYPEQPINQFKLIIHTDVYEAIKRGIVKNKYQGFILEVTNLIFPSNNFMITNK